jgi:predicted enzyme related to lactoylglutathione lyase
LPEREEAEMSIDRVYAVLCVTDMDLSRAWYERAFGRSPDAQPMDTLAEWHLTSGGGIQVFVDPDHAGSSFTTVSVADLDAVIADVSGRTVDVNAYGRDYEPFRLASITDPDGNVITFAQHVG